MPMDRERRQRDSRPGRVLLALVVAGGSAWSVYALARGLAHRVPLSILWGGGAWALLGALALGALLGAVAIARLVRGRSTSSPPPLSVWMRDAFCILVLGATAYVAFAQPFATLTFEFALGLCAGVFAARILVSHRRLPRAVGLILFNLCFLVVLAEVGLRVFASAWSSPLLTPADAGVVERIETRRLPPGKLRWGFPTNSGGHYDDEFLLRSQRSAPTIAMLGDSFSMGVVPLVFHFSTVCERLLEPALVYNLGVGAIGPIHYEHLLRTEIVPLEPDVVVLNLFVGNDITRHLEADTGGLRGWLDRDNVRLVLLPRRLAALARESREQGGTLDDVAAPQGEGELDVHWNGDLAELTRRFPWVADSTREQPTFSPQQYLEAELGRAESVCASATQGFPKLLAVLDRMRDLVPDVPFAVVLIPDEFQVEDALWDAITARASAPLDRDLPQRILVPALRQRGVPVLDLLPALRAVAPEADGSRHVYHLRDSHFNVRGNQVAGEAMAAFLEPLLH